MASSCVLISLAFVIGNLRLSSAQNVSACGGNFTGQGNLVSPNYPNSYPANVLCRYNLAATAGKVVQLKFTDFTTESGYDVFRCYNSLDLSYTTPFQAYSGIVRGTVVTRSKTVVCLFKSDAMVQFRGFKIAFSSVPPPKNSSAIGVTTTIAPQNCGGPLSTSGSLVSPGYPSSYPANKICQWQIVSNSGKFIELKILNFQTESQWDSLRISCTNSPTFMLKQYSGVIPKNTTVVFPCNVTLLFTSDGSVQSTGFSIAFRSVATSSVAPVNASGGKALLPDSCGVPPISPTTDGSRIVGGQPAVPHSWPWQVMLRYLGRFLCGGSLITNQWAVTAAHCLYGFNLTRFSVSLGKHSAGTTDSGEVNLPVIKVIIHPNYDPKTKENDITLVKFQSPVNFSKDIYPICLPSTKCQPSSLCYATGWGDLGNNSLAKVLMQASLPIVDSNTCCNFLRPACYKSMICAGYLPGGKDTCKGDSGGPLTCKVNGKFELSGVTSWGAGCARPLEPGVYTNVYGYVGWILDTIVVN